MKITKYFCDFCGEEIEKKPTYKIDGAWIHYELCYKCHKWVKETLKAKKDEKL